MLFVFPRCASTARMGACSTGLLVRWIYVRHHARALQAYVKWVVDDKSKSIPSYVVTCGGGGSSESHDFPRIRKDGEPLDSRSTCPTLSCPRGPSIDHLDGLRPYFPIPSSCTTLVRGKLSTPQASPGKMLHGREEFKTRLHFEWSRTPTMPLSQLYAERRLLSRTIVFDGVLDPSNTQRDATSTPR